MICLTSNSSIVYSLKMIYSWVFAYLPFIWCVLPLIQPSFTRLLVPYAFINKYNYTAFLKFVTSYSVFIYAIFNALRLSLWVYTLYLKCFTSLSLHIYPWISEILRLSLSSLIRCLYTVLLLSHHPYTSFFVSFVTLHPFPSTVSLRPMAAATKRKSMTMETDFIVWVIKKEG